MSETIVRSRLCGLKDIHIAEVTANNGTTYTTKTPVKLARALSAKVSDKFTTEKVYSDDNVEDIVEQYEGTEIDFSVNTLAPQDYAALYENLYKNGFLLKAAGDGAKEIAIGWRAKKRNGKYEFTWYYCGKLERPEMNYETQEDKTKTQTASLKGNFYARQKEDTIEDKKKNLYAIQVDESNLIDDNTTAKSAIADWFSEVKEYSAP
ncbi:phage major tail protein%2C phi13 family [uncultured Clostridium sp.]|uniref:major tail protein n=1 Tax=uncultured Clostridium sp. TaxID=59620 RepID=UPI0008207F27|nr:major tail protein [uncultured Clostridium sp.]SCJ09683.1 phage major tail protein%2C phi13 family [uncultured Clostridium sp.]